MEVVQAFIKARRAKEHAAASDMLSETASLGSVWGYQHGKKEYGKFLKDEGGFSRREHLDCDVITKLDDNTFMRYFRYNRGMSEQPLYRVPQYRELYFIKDGKIRCVSCSRQNITGPGYFKRSFGL
jgi:hypothetical protein